MIGKSTIFRRPVIDVIVHFGRVNPQLEGWLGGRSGRRRRPPALQPL